RCYRSSLPAKQMRQLLSIGALFTSSMTFAAQAPTAPTSRPLRLTPSPQQVRRTDGRFKVSADSSIIIDRPGSGDDRFAAQQLLDELRTALRMNVRIAPTTAPSESPSIFVGRYPNDPLVKQLSSRLPANNDVAGRDG